MLPVFIFLRAPGGDLARANLKCEGAKSKIQSATLYHPIFMSFLDLLDQKIEKFWKCFSKISLFLSKISDFSPFSHKRHKCLRAPGATSCSSGATTRSESAKMAPKRQYWQHWNCCSILTDFLKIQILQKLPLFLNQTFYVKSMYLVWKVWL